MRQHTGRQHTGRQSTGRQNRSRFVLLCQQVLAFGTVVAIAAPAAGVVSLDIVAPAPGAPSASSSPHQKGSLVASAPVAPDVTEVPVDGVDPRALDGLAARHPSPPVKNGDHLAALTAPEPVTGFATVGVTWRQGVQLADQDIAVSVRTLKDGVWSVWQDVPYSVDGPDPDSAEGRAARPGTDAVAVGNVDDVQVKAVTSSGDAPPGMAVSLIDPGATVAPKVEDPAIDTAKLASAEASTDAATLAGSPAAVTPKPQIFSRAQWGADERMRDKSSLHYGEVHAGFVHHTVNANSYSRAQVPSILRGIYAYHTQSKGWSDIGYNYLVDRFGRIWEGRYGGVDRPVVGAHTLGYNDDSFAMSAIGNYDIAAPSAAMVDAYGRLFAWKLSLHGVDAASTHQWVTKKYFRAINGHRDAGQTACPGRYLYAELPKIRSLAAHYQKPFTTREKSANISGSRWPDLVVRNKADKRAYVVQTGGQLHFGSPRVAAQRWGGMDLIAATGDLTGDGVADMMARDTSTKVTGVYPGHLGGFGGAAVTSTRFRNLDQLVAVGDMTGDGNNDIVGRDATSKRLYLYPGNGHGRFRTARLLSSDWSGYNLTVGVGDFNGDGHPDLVTRGRRGLLRLFPGRSDGQLGRWAGLPGTWAGYDMVAGMGDSTNDGLPDLVARSRTSKLTYIYPGDGRGGIGARYGPFSTFSQMNFLANAGQVAGSRSADLVGRGAAGRLVVFANSGRSDVAGIVDTGRSFSAADLILNVGDWDGDGFGDVITRSGRTGSMYLYAGDGRSHLARPVRAATSWGSVGLLAAVGDVTGDGFPDLMGQPRGGDMRIYPGNGRSGFRASYPAHSALTGDQQIGAGLWDSDGSPDSLIRRGDGSLRVYPGNGPGGLTGGSTVVATRADRYDWMQGAGDTDGDGDPDIIARETSTGKLWLLPGDGSSGLKSRRLMGEGFGRFDLGS